jgi:Protein of unknown function (DUF3592)
MEPKQTGHLRDALGERTKGQMPDVEHKVVFAPQNTYPYPWWHRTIFALLGLVMLGIGSIGGFNSYDFLKSSISAKGKIVGVSSQNYKGLVSPIFEFETLQGEIVRVTSSVGTGRQTVLVGREVNILYLPTNPHRAEIDYWSSFWLLPIVSGFLGSGFLLGGLSKQIPEFLDNLKGFRVRRGRVAVKTKFERIERPVWWMRHPYNKPYIIVSSWRDPYSAETYYFSSKPLWIDPSPFLKSQTLKVYFNSRAPRRYWMDLTLLSENKHSNELTVT